MNCPRCESLLEKATLSEYNITLEIDKCPDCKGIWFDRGELQRVEQIVEPVFVEIRSIPKEYDQLTTLNCPFCTEHPRMGKHEHPRDNKVVIDVCDNCEGIWLDGGELDAIQQESWWITLFGLRS